MAELTTKKRKKLKSKTFGLPGERKYPMPDKSHAANAKARATQQLKAGNLTAAEKEKIDRKADRVLGAQKEKKDSDDNIRDYMSKL
jgi:hypothetical protein